MTNTNQILDVLLKREPHTEEELAKVKRSLARDFGIGIVTNNWLLKIYKQALEKHAINQAPQLEQVLVKRRVRTLSGVAPITLATKPFPCPGRCVYCPTDVRMPKSYLSSQPAAARALRFKFDPYAQVQGRLKAFYDNGHKPEKCDLRILGGTWSFYPKRYQTWFVKELYRGLNSFNPKLNIPPPLKLWRASEMQNAKLKCKIKNLIDSQTINETAVHRCIGLSIETRPDWVTMDEIKRFRRFGITKVELGVQHLDRGVMDLIKRDHYKEDVTRATKLLKDAGFKVAYHIMPNLPGSTPEMDLAMFKKVFDDEGLRPDQLKIYPCVVLEKSQLYQWYQKGKFKTYDDETLIDLLSKMKQCVPLYVRIERIYRDVPTHDIIDGSRHINIRELVQERMRVSGWECRCIRCREVRDKTAIKLYSSKAIKLYIHKYTASDGIEYFISFESPDKKILYSFTRLRFPSSDSKNQLALLKNTAIIRELHTYGQLAPLSTDYQVPTFAKATAGRQTTSYNQHRGLGKKLLQKAEQIAKKAGYAKIAVISGVGVREYYKRLGYGLEEAYGYMVKNL